MTVRSPDPMVPASALRSPNGWCRGEIAGMPGEAYRVLGSGSPFGLQSMVEYIGAARRVRRGSKMSPVSPLSLVGDVQLLDPAESHFSPSAVGLR
jgi:hypothetical protein